MPERCSIQHGVDEGRCHGDQDGGHLDAACTIDKCVIVFFQFAFSRDDGVVQETAVEPWETHDDASWIRDIYHWESAGNIGPVLVVHLELRNETTALDKIAHYSLVYACNALFSTSHSLIFTFYVSHVLMVTLYLILLIYQF